MTARPTPESTRREGVPSRPVRLADGRDWGLSLPTVRLTPRLEVRPDEFGRPVERVTVDLGFGYPAEIQRLLDRVGAACEGGTASDQYTAFFSLAASLLRRAHDVSLVTACDLLAVPEDELPRLVGAVMAVVSARPPATGQPPHGGPIS
jgi:hypothetical protein